MKSYIDQCPELPSVTTIISSLYDIGYKVTGYGEKISSLLDAVRQEKNNLISGQNKASEIDEGMLDLASMIANAMSMNKLPDSDEQQKLANQIQMINLTDRVDELSASIEIAEIFVQYKPQIDPLRFVNTSGLSIADGEKKIEAAQKNIAQLSRQRAMECYSIWRDYTSRALLRAESSLIYAARQDELSVGFHNLAVMYESGRAVRDTAQLDVAYKYLTLANSVFVLPISDPPSSSIESIPHGIESLKREIAYLKQELDKTSNELAELRKKTQGYTDMDINGPGSLLTEEQKRAQEDRRKNLERLEEVNKQLEELDREEMAAKEKENARQQEYEKTIEDLENRLEDLKKLPDSEVSQETIEQHIRDEHIKKEFDDHQDDITNQARDSDRKELEKEKRELEKALNN